MNKNEKVCIGWIDSGTVYSGFIAYLSQILINRSNRINDVVVASGPYLSWNRNSMIDMFLETESDWLLSLDSDLCIPIESFDELVQSVDKDEYPIMGGLYYLPLNGGKNIFPSAMKLLDDKQGVFLSMEECSKDKGIVTNLHSVGNGFSMIHRSVFEKIKDANGQKLGWFKDEYREEYDTWISDDVYFYAQCRALGIKISLNTNTTSQHLKVFKVDENSFLNHSASMMQHNHNHDHDHGHDHSNDVWPPNKKTSWWTKKKKV